MQVPHSCRRARLAEERVHVASSGDSFFDVRIDGEAGWLVEAVNGPMFLPALNGQASVFGAKLVIAHAAAAAAAAAAAPSPNRTAPGAR